MYEGGIPQSLRSGHRVREFKQMVQSLHKSGIRVIMDVVYNHTFVGGESHLNQLVPDYFYRFRQDSTWSNASGCGNETASERAMMRKFIIESVVYWATEYKVDGFRFDLMGIHDIETMNAIRAALDKVDPTIYVYGEGWTADSSPLPEEKRAVKKNAKLLNNIGVFSDDLRDALKGSWMNKEIPGFASGVDSLEESVKFGITAAAFHPQVDYTKPIYSKEPYTNNRRKLSTMCPVTTICVWWINSICRNRPEQLPKSLFVSINLHNLSYLRQWVCHLCMPARKCIATKKV
jgi:pullulanase